MLQFWKKNSSKIKGPTKCKEEHVNGVVLPVGVLLPTLFDSNLEGPLSNFEHDGYSNSPPAQCSRLETNLSNVLEDEMALPYFFQFVEVRGWSLLVNFLLDLQLCNSVQTSQVKDSASPLPPTYKDLCDRYLSEEVIQRYRLPEDLCVSFQACASQYSTEKSQIFHQMEDFIYQTLKRELWPDFVRSEFFSKFQVEVLTSGSVTLTDIMYHSTSLRAFTEFLEQEGCQSVIEFWQAATAFQSQLGPDCDPAATQNEAINIYDKYLSLQATCPLGVDHATRCEVEHRICVEGAAPRSDCLEPALRRAWGYLNFVCLPIFLSSQSYVQLISELMRASRANSSPASSMTDVSVDSSHSRYDPDIIWRRRHHQRGLSIGRIDQLGRFETDIEPEPDKKSESRITRVVKRFVNKDEHKAQEEMAWRVAEMIVKDVTNLTMGGQEDDT